MNITKNKNKISFDITNIENLTFKEILTNSIQYHDNLLADFDTYDLYIALFKLHRLSLCGFDKTWVYTVLDELEYSNKILFAEKHIIECVIDIKMGTNKESLILIEYQNALTYQIQSLIYKAITEQEKLEFIEFLSIQLSRHFKVYDDGVYKGKGNYFFLFMFYHINMFMTDRGDISEIPVYKNFCINLDKKYQIPIKK